MTVESWKVLPGTYEYAAECLYTRNKFRTLWSNSEELVRLEPQLQILIYFLTFFLFITQYSPRLAEVTNFKNHNLKMLKCKNVNFDGILLTNICSISYLCVWFIYR